MEWVDWPVSAFIQFSDGNIAVYGHQKGFTERRSFFQIGDMPPVQDVKASISEHKRSVSALESLRQLLVVRQNLVSRSQRFSRSQR